MTPPPAGAQLVGTDTAPGDPCTAKGATRINANSEGAGAYVLSCNDNNSQWVATFNVETPTTPAQAANKDYVDTAIAAAGLTACTDNTADKCILERTRAANDPDFIPENIAEGVNILGIVGTYTPAIVHPEPFLSGPAECPEIGDLCPSDSTIYAGHHPTLQVPLYIPPTDEGELKWRESGTDAGPASIDDGRANTNLIPNEA
ncbi:MAG TPA: hypothetical protein VNQ90_10415, partial [Chthoniobacteraceae bacterium]|nr:hypothetical protein [Chthoniobacteraceae bacterium]